MKDFDAWNVQKKKLNTQTPRLPKRRWVWWAVLGVNIGHEQDGGKKFERPVLVIKVFKNNTCLVVPITRTRKQDAYSFDLQPHGYEGSVILSQLRLIGTERLRRDIVRIDEHVFGDIVATIRRVNGL